MAPGGPVFALTSYASAGDSCRETTGHETSQPVIKTSWIKGAFFVYSVEFGLNDFKKSKFLIYVQALRSETNP